MLKIAGNFSKFVNLKINFAKKGIQKQNEEKTKRKREKQELEIQNFVHELREYHAAKKDPSVNKYNVMSFEYYLKHGKEYDFRWDRRWDKQFEANRTKYLNTDYQSAAEDYLKQYKRQAEEEKLQKKLKNKQDENRSWARLVEHFEEQEEYCAQRTAYCRQLDQIRVSAKEAEWNAYAAEKKNKTDEWKSNH